MQKIYDKRKIDAALKDCIYADMLYSLAVPLFLIRYSAGETLSSPLSSDCYFQIVLSGDLRIVYIRDDGSVYSLASGSQNYIIGELDLFSTHDSSVFAEASDDVITIAFDSGMNKTQLFKNAAFMAFCASIMAQKLSVVMKLDASSSSLNDRVLNYMKYKCENGTLKGLENAAFKLHCSSRQLQRILNQMEADTVVRKEGKGTYLLLL